MSALFFAEHASAHGRMTKPMTRIGSATAYENDPIGFQGRPMTNFACRNGKNPNVQPEEYTAGDTITLEWDLTANHIGDAGIYISYDHDVPHSEIYKMWWFKIANIPNARDHKKSLGLDYQITLPSWLPGGKAVLRWEWYALHVNPTIELYAQCADIIITPGASPVALMDIAMYPVVDASGNTKTLPLYNTDMAIYRNGFDPASPQWHTGPACARDFGLNDCAATAVGTKGNIDPLSGNNSGGDDLVTPAPVTPAPVDDYVPAPVDNPTEPPTSCSHQVAGERCTTTGEAGIETCCAAGHYCAVYSQWWSSCTLGSDPNGPSPQPVTTPAPVEAPVTAPTEPVTTLPPPTSSPVATPTGECTCVSIDARATNEWCEAVACASAYADFCELSCDGTTGAPATTTTGAPATTTTGAAPAPVTTPAPVEAPVTSPTEPVTTPAPVEAPVTSPTEPVTTLPPPTSSPVTTPTTPTDEFVIMGYVENWKSFSDMSKFDSYTHLLYSFLTLDSAPFPDAPHDTQWDGQAIYETMTLADVLDVMVLCDGCAAYENPHNWQRQKIVALMDYCTENGKTFLWAFGGWSDLKRTIADDQVDTLVAMLVELLETVGGDGIDFDWEHLSAYKDIDNALHAQQRQIVGKVIVALKDALVARGMADKLITYTPRYNAFLEGGAYNTNQFGTDGEGIDIVEYVVANSAHGVDAIDFVHYMMYDINAQEGFQNAPEEYFVEEHYDAVIQSSLDYIPASKIVIGFESGPQAYTGVSGGIEHEKNIIDYIMDRVGGVMFWAANEAAIASNGVTTGENSGTLAAYAASLRE